MPHRLSGMLTVLALLAFMLATLPGCSGQEEADTATAHASPAATESNGDEVAAEPAAEPEPQAEPEPEPEPEPQDDAEADDASDSPEVEPDITVRHIGAWRGANPRQANSVFIFTEDGRVQVGSNVMMFNGEYTIDYEHELPLLVLTLDVAGNMHSSEYFLEFLPDDRMRLHSLRPDPESPSGFTRVGGDSALLLERDE